MELDTAATEFDRQLSRLLVLGYPALAGHAEPEFRAALEPLRVLAASLSAGSGGGRAATPFVIVVPAAMAPPEAAMKLTSLANGEPGFAALDPCTSEDFPPLARLALPAGPYLAAGIETGAEYLNVTPEDALRDILARGRSPVTVEEGIAVVTHLPHLLGRNACFSLPGSRGSDQRVPAIWISGGRPRLGWCWDRNPHTWLGSASCAFRIGAG